MASPLSPRADDLPSANSPYPLFRTNLAICHRSYRSHRSREPLMEDYLLAFAMVALTALFIGLTTVGLVEFT